MKHDRIQIQLNILYGSATLQFNAINKKILILCSTLQATILMLFNQIFMCSLDEVSSRTTLSRDVIESQLATLVEAGVLVTELFDVIK